MRHLDLGCGLSPKNPYKYDELYGCDLRDLSYELAKKGIIFKKANLVFDPIPFEDNSFDSVSAMDFLEHIPRQINEPNGGLRNAFVLVMNGYSSPMGFCLHLHLFIHILRHSSTRPT
jgi:hypothetical protein